MTAPKHKAHTVQPTPTPNDARSLEQGLETGLGLLLLLGIAVLVIYVRWRLTWGRIGRAGRASVQKGN